MANLLEANAEGIAHGTVITLANSGGSSGDAFQQLTRETNATLTATTTNPAMGLTSFRITTTGAASNNRAMAFWNWTTGIVDFSAGFMYRMDALPSIDYTILRVYQDQSYTTRTFDLVVTDTGRLTIVEQATNTLAATSGSVGLMAIGTTYWIQVRGNGNDGTLRVEQYAKDSITLRASAQLSGLTINAARAVRFGMATQAAITAFNFDFYTAEGAIARPDILGGAVDTTADSSLGADISVEPYGMVAQLDGATSNDKESPVTTYSFSVDAASPSVTLSGSLAKRYYTPQVTLDGTPNTFGLIVQNAAAVTSSKDQVVHNVLGVNERVFLPSGGGPATNTLLGVGGGNVDPSYLEGTAAGNLGIRRLYYHIPGDESAAIGKIQEDQAKGRISWLSLKLDGVTWAQCASGAMDTTVTNFNNQLAALNLQSDVPVWLCFHHEPEGDDVTSDFKLMQNRLIPRITAPNVKCWIILTGWHEIFGSNSFTEWWPTTVVPYGIAIDPYNWYSTGEPPKTAWDELNIYYAATKAFADSKGVKWGIAEFGLDHDAYNDVPRDGAHWIDRAYNDANALGCAGMSYFDTNLNNPANTDWRLSTLAGKQASFMRALTTSKAATGSATPIQAPARILVV